MTMVAAAVVIVTLIVVATVVPGSSKSNPKQAARTNLPSLQLATSSATIRDAVDSVEVKGRAAPGNYVSASIKTEPSTPTLDQEGDFSFRVVDLLPGVTQLTVYVYPSWLDRSSSKSAVFRVERVLSTSYRQRLAALAAEQQRRDAAAAKKAAAEEAALAAARRKRESYLASLTDYQEGLYELKVTKCSSSYGYAEMTGWIKNTGDTTRSFYVNVSFRASSSYTSTRLGDGFDYVTDLRPGERATWTASDYIGRRFWCFFESAELA